MHKIPTLLNVDCASNYVWKLNVNVRKCRLFVKISFDISPIIKPMTPWSWVFNHRKIIPFVINNNVHYFKFARIFSKQMNSTPSTKRLRYSLISKHRYHPSLSHSIHQHPLTIKSQSTILAEKYLLLLQVIQDMRSDIRRSYAGSRTSMENLRKRIIKTRTIVLQCKDLCSRREFDHCQILMQYPSTSLSSKQ